MIEKYYDFFVKEAETFFVTKFHSSETIRTEFSFCLDALFDISKNKEISIKGIIAYNPRYGQGKSFFFEVASHFYKRFTGHKIYHLTTARDLALLYKEKGEGALLEAISAKNLFIDDIGDEGENKEFFYMGNRLNVIRWVLFKRYEMWYKYGHRTFGTTNLTLSDIAKVYDGRLSDRLMQMCHFRHFDFLAQGSFRQIKDTRRLTKGEIDANWEKIIAAAPKQEPYKFNPIEYLNGMLAETEEYLNVSEHWKFIKEQLLATGYLKQADIDSEINDGMLKTVETIERVKAKETVKVLSKHAIPAIQAQKRDEELSKITTSTVRAAAENVIAKRRFFELKNIEGFTFT